VIKKKALNKIFGVGLFGALFSIFVWLIAIIVERALAIPVMSIHPILRTGLIIMFTIDALYLLIGSNYQLKRHGRGKVLVNSGPYQFIRHPIYSVWIYSFSGILAMLFHSWLLIASVIPINLFWSWLVTFEETRMLKHFGDKYKDVIENTGQFLPSWKAMREHAREENN
jgi:protein-S-isoprenylcysteine O-methyltransferase Ste14